MSNAEILVAVGGAVLGYWLVTRMLNNSVRPGSVDDEVSDAGSAQPSAADGETESPAPPADHREYIQMNWFRILGVSPDASQSDIIAAYRCKIGQYHPDKVAKMGVEIRELAEMKSKEILAAYAYAVKLRE